MANICWFELRVRGTKENCTGMMDSGLACEEAYVKAAVGNENDYMATIAGVCHWSVMENMVTVDEAESLLGKAKRFHLEIEACGMSEDGTCEHFHYHGAEVIKETYCLPGFSIAQLDDLDLSDEELAKYEKNDEVGMYILKEEFEEGFYFDEDLGEPVFRFDMSMEGASESEEPEEESFEGAGGLFGSSQGILAMMGITADENGFAIVSYEDSHTASLFDYFGKEKTVIVPEGVTTLEEGCFSGNDTAEEIVLPSTLKVIRIDCFQHCSKLKTIVIPASVTDFEEGEDNCTFSGTPQVVVVTPAGSCAEAFAQSKGIKTRTE